MDTSTTVTLLIIVAAVVSLLVVLATRRRRRFAVRSEPSREDLAAIAENQRTHGSREHGQNVSSNRWADGGGWGG